MFTVEGHTEGFVNRLRGAVEGLEGAQKNAKRALLEAFVAGLAADPAATPKTVSSLLAQKVPGVGSGTAKVYRSNMVSTFNEPGAVVALRKALKPERMTVAQFEEAVRTYADGVTVMDSRAKAAAKKAAEAAKPEPSETDVPDLGSKPAADPVLTAQTLALQGIAALAKEKKGAQALRAVLNAALDATRPHLGAEELRELQVRLSPALTEVKPTRRRKAA